MLKEFIRRSIIQAAEKYFGLTEKTIVPFPNDSYFTRSLWRSSDAYQDPLSEPYKNSIWTYAAINTIAKNAAKVPLRLYRRDALDTPIEQGNIYNLLRNPNPFMTNKVFIEAISIFLSIYGEAALLINRKDVTETPLTIWALSPIRFEIVFNETKNMMVGWIYHGLQDIPLKTFEVLLLKYFNPYNDLRGLSPLEPARLAINNDWYASKYNESFFKQGAKTSGFITVDGELDDKQFNRMIAQFEERHQGYERAHRIALLEGGAKFTETKITQKDMEYIQLKKLSREEIFAAYKVNEVVLGIYEDVQSYEGIKMSHKAFWEEAMVPHLGFIEDYLNDTLFLQIEHGQYMVKFDFATVGELHDDYKSRVETAKIMNAIGFPINEINRRLQLGMPEVPWGDVWWVPMGVSPATDIMDNAKDNSDDKKPPKEPVDDNEDGTGSDDTDQAKDDKKILWQRYLSTQFRLEELFRNKIKKFVFEQRKMVLENIAKDKYPVFDYNKEVAKLQRLMNSLYIEALRIGAAMIVEENGGSPLQFKLEHPEVSKYLETRCGVIPSKIMGTIYKGLEKIFSRKEAKELYAESVRILYNSVTKRVGTIARTESSSVLVAGRVIQMQRLGCRYHQWVTARHDASRESHKELDGKVVKIGDSFVKGITLRYPGDLMAPPGEIVNCRCFTIMVKS